MIVSYPTTTIRKSATGYEQKYLSYDTDIPHNFTATWKEVQDAEITMPAALPATVEAEVKEAEGVR